jgi:hypothetical protein
LVFLGIAAVIAAAWYVARSSSPPTVPRPIANASAPEEAPPLFADWVRFERVTGDTRERLRHYYIDAVLAHQVFRMPPSGIPQQLAQQLILDDDELLLSSGRRLWNRKLLHQPGLAGQFCYVHSTYCLKRLFDVSFFVDRKPIVVYDNQYGIERFPSHTTVHYLFPQVAIDEYKFITYDDRAVASYAVRSADGQAHEVTIEAAVPYPPVPMGNAAPDYPLLGRGQVQGLPLFLYLDAPGFERVAALGVTLQKTLAISAEEEPLRATLAFRFDNEERTQPAAPLQEDPLPAQVREYNRWFADNVPYFDASDAAFKKMWYYRWWIVRFHLVEALARDLDGFAFYEGKLGFDNLIGFAVPAQLKELSYLRDPRYGLSQARNSYRNLANNGAVRDAPGSPYWGETYSHWIAMALAEFHRVHPIPIDDLRKILPAAAADVRAWLSAYDQDGDALPERERPRVTGYDLDILSYWFFNGLKIDQHREPPSLERVDFASFVYGNAAAIAELAESTGDQDLVREFTDHANRVRKATLSALWDDKTEFFYPRGAEDHTRIPIRELHGFFPFTTRLAPDEPRYLTALRKLVDPSEFWARFPPVITSTAHYREWTWEMDGLTRNIAPHPISMGGRTLLQVLKHYHQDIVTADHFMELMEHYNALVYPAVYPGDPLWRPNVHEYYSHWEPHSISPRPKPSDISHDFHSMYCSLVVEGVVGLTPRGDDKIELQPLARHWDYFLLHGLRYHGHDLTIVWDRPDGQNQYPSYPEGFSLFVDDAMAFTRPALAHVVFDPATREVTLRPDTP